MNVEWLTMDIKEKAKMLPSSPGVYLMKDLSGHIIYVGKSKNLKNRVQSYLYHSKNHTKKVEKLVNHLRDFDYILTDTEFEAFILECKLIKEFQPMYNRVMKTPKSYTYIKIRKDTFELTSSRNTNDGYLYFGPYTNKKTVEEAVNGIKEFYQINCNNPLNNHTPCFNYSIGKCMGICFKNSAIEQYHKVLNRTIAFLQGKDKTILEEMEQKMINAASTLDFELAAEIKEWLKSVRALYKKGKVIQFTKENNYIVVAEFLEDNKLKLFLIRGNHILYKEIFKLNNINLKELCSLIRSSILQDFKDISLPKDIRKDEIDEAQIIYSYLNSNACEYFIIPEEWLTSDTNTKIEKSIHDLLDTRLLELY